MEPLPFSLGHFRVSARLGEGGSGTVYAAWQGEQRVALKVLRRDLELGPREVRRFLAEAERLARVAHPHVVRLLGSGCLPDGRPYLVMPLLEGQSLAARLAEGPLPPARALALFGQLADAVGALHAAGLVHRDLKPENVMLVEPERLVLLDFGIARELEGPPSTTSRAGIIRGTPAYLAPEIFFGGPATVGSDVYQLGVVLYQMLAGELPWPVDNPSDPAARLSPRAPRGVAPALAREVLRALATVPTARPASAAALAAGVAAAAAALGDTPRTTLPLAPAGETPRTALPQTTAATLPASSPPSATAATLPASSPPSATPATPPASSPPLAPAMTPRDTSLPLAQAMTPHDTPRAPAPRRARAAALGAVLVAAAAAAVVWRLGAAPATTAAPTPLARPATAPSGATMPATAPAVIAAAAPPPALTPTPAPAPPASAPADGLARPAPSGARRAGRAPAGAPAAPASRTAAPAAPASPVAAPPPAAGTATPLPCLERLVHLHCATEYAIVHPYRCDAYRARLTETRGVEPGEQIRREEVCAGQYPHVASTAQTELRRHFRGRRPPTFKDEHECVRRIRDLVCAPAFLAIERASCADWNRKVKELERATAANRTAAAHLCRLDYNGLVDQVAYTLRTKGGAATPR